MPRQGNGTYALPANTWFPGVNGVTATTNDWNTTAADIQAALTQSVSADGQTPMTGNLAMGNNKITGLATGTANTDAANVGQLPSFGVWQTGVPSILPATGSFTNASAAIRYKINGKSVFFSLVVTIITNGTAAGTIQVFLPWTSVTESAFGGRESQTTGNAVAATISPASSTLTIVKYDNTYPGGNSYRIAINGVMETA